MVDCQVVFVAATLTGLLNVDVLHDATHLDHCKCVVVDRHMDAKKNSLEVVFSTYSSMIKGNNKNKPKKWNH